MAEIRRPDSSPGQRASGSAARTANRRAAPHGSKPPDREYPGGPVLLKIHEKNPINKGFFTL